MNAPLIVCSIIGAVIVGISLAVTIIGCIRFIRDWAARADRRELERRGLAIRNDRWLPPRGGGYTGASAGRPAPTTIPDPPPGSGAGSHQPKLVVNRYGVNETPPLTPERYEEIQHEFARYRDRMAAKGYHLSEWVHVPTTTTEEPR